MELIKQDVLRDLSKTHEERSNFTRSSSARLLPKGRKNLLRASNRRLRRTICEIKINS